MKPDVKTSFKLAKILSWIQVCKISESTEPKEYLRAATEPRKSTKVMHWSRGLPDCFQKSDNCDVLAQHKESLIYRIPKNSYGT